MEVKNDRDEKQDELIRQLREGQEEIVRAIEYDLRAKTRAKAHKDSDKPLLDFDIDEPTPKSKIDVLDEDSEPSTSKVVEKELIKPYEVVDVDKGIGNDYEEILNEKELPLPSEIIKSDLDVDYYMRKTMGKIRYINDYVDKHSRKGKHKKELDDNMKQTYDRNKKRLPYPMDYLERLNKINAAPQHKGTGIFSQRKRNAYKIGQGGSYGNLTIDFPKLMGQLRLVAHKNGSKVYDKVVDFDTIDLLTKRFNSRKNYSNLSKKVLEELNSLSKIPIHKTSKKYQKIGSGVKFFSDPNDLITRMELLVGEMNAGNDSNDVKNEFIEIVHVLHKLGLIDVSQLNSLLRDYVI